MVKAGEQAPTQFDAAACLLCDNWRQPAGDAKSSRRKFQSHLEKHLQELAREALPLAIDGLEIKDSQEDDESDPGDATDQDAPDSETWHHTRIGLVDLGKAGRGGWLCLGPGEDREEPFELCVSDHRTLQLLTSHYKRAHAEVREVYTAYVCINCGEAKMERSCDSCIGQEPRFQPLLQASVSSSGSVTKAFVEKLEKLGGTGWEDLQRRLLSTMEKDQNELEKEKAGAENTIKESVESEGKVEAERQESYAESKKTG